MYRNIYLSLVLCLTSRFTFAQQSIKYIDSLRSAYSIPEVSYAVITDKDIKEISATGFHSAILPEPATLEDRFHIGSNTKALTAFIIAKYVEKGKLKWNDQFFTLFPEWKKDARKEYAHITLEELLSHRALIQPFQGENDPAIPDFKGNKQEKRESFGKFVLTLDPVKADPEHPFVYSNAGYTLATLMLEKVTHQSWEQLVDKVFNKDLHLDVQFSWPDNQTKKDTWGHSFENGKLTPIASNTDYKLDYTEPSGDLNIRLKDYIKFIQLNLLGLEGKNNYLKSSTYNYIHNHFPGYSFGWFTVLENNINWSTHSGTAGTYYSMVQIDKTHSLAYIVFTNSFNEDTVNGVRLMIRKLKSTYGK